MNIEYNTQKEPIVLREYGRTIQKLVKHVRDEPDKEKRNQLAAKLVHLIEKLSTGYSSKNSEITQKIWDNIYAMADFDLDIDSPYPMPDRKETMEKPKKIDYPKMKSHSRHGKNLDKLVEIMLTKKDPKEREKATIYLGRFLNTFLKSGNKGDIDKTILIRELEHLLGKEYIASTDLEKNNLFEKLYQEKKKGRSQSQQNQKKLGGKRYLEMRRRKHS